MQTPSPAIIEISYIFISLQEIISSCLKCPDEGENRERINNRKRSALPPQTRHGKVPSRIVTCHSVFADNRTQINSSRALQTSIASEVPYFRGCCTASFSFDEARSSARCFARRAKQATRTERIKQMHVPRRSKQSTRGAKKKAKMATRRKPPPAIGALGRRQYQQGTSTFRGTQNVIRPSRDIFTSMSIKNTRTNAPVFT